MGYIDNKLGIKSTKSLQKYLQKITAKDVHVYKSSDYIHIIWSLGDKLYEHKIKANVIYCVKEEELHETIDVILKTTNEYLKSIQPKINLEL